jgi:hypothetical protein
MKKLLVKIIGPIDDWGHQHGFVPIWVCWVHEWLWSGRWKR